jgi:uncharacterized protein
VTFSSIARAAGGLTAASVTRSLGVLTGKRLVARHVPLSAKPSKEARYRITDPYLSFWLRFIRPGLAEIERGRGDRVLARVRRDFTTWRGRAVEPLVREALGRLSPIDGLPPATTIGAYWSRTNSPEVDIVGADTGPVANTIAYAGSIKWLEDAPFAGDDARHLSANAAMIPGVSTTTPLLAVSRSGVTARDVVAIGPDALLRAWR